MWSNDEMKGIGKRKKRKGGFGKGKGAKQRRNAFGFVVFGLGYKIKIIM